ncbi:4Fe-4S single cluster domain-containing protein [Nocardia sp. NPDC057663]|uniref:4Fe-4S single cluster domain-containing protein n=1 Tax=Nocardia sp. NPDC057663 TaxID=3346201 RepID=UPI00366D8AFB
MVTATAAEGPGIRTAIWVQGCAIRCAGCFNPHMWAPAGGDAVPVAEWIEQLIDDAVTAQTEGITLLGGEPFDQAAPLARCAAAVRARGLSVMTFTGYTYADLRTWARHRRDIADLLAHTDLLADGPFRADLLDHRRPWVGSTNQGLRALTSRYADLDYAATPDRIEVRVGVDGMIEVNGWGDLESLDALLADLGTRSDGPRARKAGFVPGPHRT